MSDRPEALDRWIEEGMLTEGQYDTIWNAKSGRMDNPALDNLLAWLVPQVTVNVLAIVENQFRAAAAEYVDSRFEAQLSRKVNLDVAEQMAQTRISIEIDMERYDV